LSRREREISTPGDDGKRARRTKSLLFIEPNPEWVARQLESMRLAALPIVVVPALQAPVNRMIAGPVTVDADMGEDDDELDVLLDELDDYGVQFYGPEQWDTKRGELAKFASEGATTDVGMLDAAKLDALIKGLKKRLDERTAAKQNDGKQPA
jgi:hypothetical protein